MGRALLNATKWGGWKSLTNTVVQERRGAYMQVPFFVSDRSFGGAEGAFHRAGPNRATWPSILTENPYERAELGPRFGPTLCEFCSEGLLWDNMASALTIKSERGSAHLNLQNSEAAASRVSFGVEADGSLPLYLIPDHEPLFIVWIPASCGEPL